MENKINLPDPQAHPSKVIKSLINKRYSCRSFLDRPIKKEDLSLVLWAAYGKRLDAITGATRTVPSAGAIYPLNIYVLIAKDKVESIEAGIYEYVAEENSIVLKKKGEEFPALLANACLGQDFIEKAPINIIICAVYGRMKSRYAARSTRYTDMEVGHCCQNIYLATYELGLGTVEVGAFSDERVRKILNLDKNEIPLAIMPIGYPK